MAWISVHEDVAEGPKLRSLYKDLKCSRGEALGILNFLWMFGLGNADKFGCIICADKSDISLYISYMNAGSKLNADTVVETLIETGWLDQTGDSLCIHDWDTWQAQWYKAQERRSNDAKRKREARSNNKLQSQAEATDEESADTPQDIPQPSHADAPLETSKTPEPPKEPTAPTYTPAFETFWKAYPRQIDKGNAYKKYNARLKDGYSPDELLYAAKAYADQCRKLKTERQFIKHPKTFLSDTLPFTDFLPKRFEDPQQETIPGANPFQEYEDGDPYG